MRYIGLLYKTTQSIECNALCVPNQCMQLYKLVICSLVCFCLFYHMYNKGPDLYVMG